VHSWQFGADAKALGYTQIVIKGLRYSGATAGTDQAERNLIINLVK
jgi:hypothetical protein